MEADVRAGFTLDTTGSFFRKRSIRFRSNHPHRERSPNSPYRRPIGIVRKSSELKYRTIHQHCEPAQASSTFGGFAALERPTRP
jgi:hypothetical protein